MGAKKFMQCEATKIFSIELNENEETELIYEEVLEFIYEEFSSVTVNSIKGCNIDISNNPAIFESNSNYPEVHVGTIKVTKMYSDVEVSTLLHAYLISGYETGFNMDYITEVLISGLDEDTYKREKLADLDLSIYSSKMNKGICAIQKRNILKFADKIFGEIIPQVESIFENVQNYLLARETSVEEELLPKEAIDKDVFGDPELGQEDITHEDSIEDSEEDLF